MEYTEMKENEEGIFVEEVKKPFYKKVFTVKKVVTAVVVGAVVAGVYLYKNSDNFFSGN